MKINTTVRTFPSPYEMITWQLMLHPMGGRSLQPMYASGMYTLRCLQQVSVYMDGGRAVVTFIAPLDYVTDELLAEVAAHVSELLDTPITLTPEPQGDEDDRYYDLGIEGTPPALDVPEHVIWALRDAEIEERNDQQDSELLLLLN